MPALTPNRGYPYPVAGDSGEVAPAIEAFAEAVDLDMQALASSINQRPMAKVSSRSGTRQNFPPRLNTELTFDFVDIDTHGSVNLSTAPTKITPKLSGWWYCTVLATCANTSFGTSRQLQLRQNSGATSTVIGWSSAAYFAQQPTLHVIQASGLALMNGSTDNFSATLNPAGPSDDALSVGLKFMSCFRVWGP